jgi:hypothetical protein
MILLTMAKNVVSASQGLGGKFNSAVSLHSINVNLWTAKVVPVALN